MPDRSKSWTSAQRDRIEASKVMPYLIAVANGEAISLAHLEVLSAIADKAGEPLPKYELIDERRIRTCLALLSKRLPDMKSTEVRLSVDETMTEILKVAARGPRFEAK